MSSQSEETLQAKKAARRAAAEADRAQGDLDRERKKAMGLEEKVQILSCVLSLVSFL